MRVKMEVSNFIYAFIITAVLISLLSAYPVYSDHGVYLRQIRPQVQSNSSQQLSPSGTYNTDASIGPDTPYSYIKGYKVFDLGSIPATNYSAFASPCNPHYSGSAYRKGIYNCQPIRSNHGASAGSVSNAASTELLNWAGYVGIVSSHSATSVQGSWTVQAAAPSSSATYSAQWAGIGGFNDGTLIQAGTEIDYYNGAAHYTAWYELLPAYETVISNLPVSPGDNIYVNITAVPNRANNWTITLIDKTTGEGFTINASYQSSQNSSEWVEERPEVCSSSCSLANLTNFGESYYGYDYTGNALTNYAEMGYGIQPVSQLPGLTSMTMVSNTAAAILAQPSPLTSDGTSFSVSYGPQSATTYSLTVTPSPSSGGTVFPSGTSNYAPGAQVTISETPAAGYAFTGWTCTGTGCYSGQGSSNTFTITSDVTETAGFQPNAPQYVLTVNNDGCTSVSASGTYNAGSIATFSATVPSGYTFIGWTGSGTGSYSGTNNPASVTMNNSMTETATCTPLPISYTLTVKSIPHGGGSVSPSGTYTYPSGSMVTISETPASGHTFTGWTCTGTGCYAGAAQSTTIMVSSNTVETAQFTKSGKTGKH